MGPLVGPVLYFPIAKALFFLIRIKEFMHIIAFPSSIF